MAEVKLWLVLGVALAIGLVLWLALAASKSGGGRTADALRQAEVYLAYGRKRQALEVLEEGLRNDPGRADIAERIRALKNS
ncbi:type IV pilus assembly protein FimV [Roseateles sp.]|uniref:type IV pilus assembly protein FimV n=1 Tax=Roseateles sp. TaxID=1971397 RepID=UPI004037210F